MLFIASFVTLSACSSSTEPVRAQPKFYGLDVSLLTNRPTIGTGGVVTATLTFANNNGGQIELGGQALPALRPHASNDNLVEDSAETILGRNPDPGIDPVLDIPPHRSVTFDFHFTGAHRGDSEIDFIYPIQFSTGYATFKVARSVMVN